MRAKALLLRQSRLAFQRRGQSTTGDAAAKAREGASDMAGKAQQGLSRVTSSAGSVLSNSASTVSKTLSSVGGRTGQIIQLVQRMIPPTTYYMRVLGELFKLTFQARNMAPPTMQTIERYMGSMRNSLRNPSSLMQQATRTAESTGKEAVNNPQSLMSRVRNMDSATMTSMAVVAAELLGFFSVGEMIGRFKIVGYRGETHH
ncbi:F-type H+-transporting ATPase subunit G [Piedraia hortae CBS 480.64]|uniref:F-type H+-transporting ATPase subunit G n=1 Tax=Piedraia hortae CBS 480.64 TaxID=1314780 RepID=A0A6A7C474_9PEZI|nr:F-type H+-transporting ATPase subunit G [Piedraia hortae CBS 480.64]